MDRSDDGGSETPRRAPDQTVSEAVVYAVADVTDTDPIELEPLYSAIDPDALDALYSRHAVSHPSRVTFTFSGHEVTVLDDGRIRVERGSPD